MNDFFSTSELIAMVIAIPAIAWIYAKTQFAETRYMGEPDEHENTDNARG